MAYPQAEHIYTRKQVLDRVRALIAEEIEGLENEIGRESELEERGGTARASLLIHLDGQLSAYLHLLQRIDALKEGK